MYVLANASLTRVTTDLRVQQHREAKSEQQISSQFSDVDTLLKESLVCICSSYLSYSKMMSHYLKVPSNYNNIVGTIQLQKPHQS